MLVAVMPMMSVPPVPDPPELLELLDPVAVVDEEPQAAATMARTAVIATQRPLRNIALSLVWGGFCGWVWEETAVGSSGRQRLRVGMQDAGDAMPRRDLDKRWTVAGAHVGGVGATGAERAP
jgi:hypothetical protein